MPGGSDRDSPLVYGDTLTAESRVGPAADGPRPRRLGRFELRGELGAGGMGVVYRAYDPTLQREVALKLLHREASGSPERRARLLREARAMARVTHPNVIQVYEVGATDGIDYVAMELIEGQTVKEWLRDEARSWREIARVFLLAGRGLAAAHQGGLVHRDFKPSNVLLATDGRVLVTDFGLARRAREDCDDATGGELEESLLVTRTGALLGTPAYMAPEQLAAAEVDERADQYSFAVSLYEALYGTRPFSADSIEELRLAVEQGRMDGAHLRRGAPSRLRRLVLRGLEREPARRFPSMEPLLAGLERCLGRRRRWAMAGVGVAVAVAIAGLAIWSRPVGDEVSAAGCDQVDALFDPAWGTSSRAQVRQAFASAGAAGDRFTAFAGALDRYRAGWERQYRRACGQRDQLSEERFHGTVACLLSQRGEIAGFVDEYAEPDTAMITHGLEAVGELPSPAACEHPLAAARRPRVPDDPAVRSSVRELRAELARIRPQQRSGRRDRANQRARDVVERARSLGYRPLIAEALHTLGLGLYMAGEADEARQALEEAVLAAEESGHDRLRARALVDLLRTELRYSSNPHTTERVVRRAVAAAERVGGDGDLEGDLLIARAEHAQQQGRFQQALELLQRAEALYADLEDDWGRAFVWDEQAWVHQALGDPERAVELARRSLEMKLSQIDGIDYTVAWAHDRLAASLRAAGRYREAREQSDLARAFWDSPEGRAALASATGHPRRSGDERLAGRVVDRRGRPLAGVDVAVALEEMRGDGERAIGDGGGEWRWNAGFRHVVTDDRGRFEVVGLPASGPFCVVAEAPSIGRSIYRRQAAGGTVELVVHPYGAVRGGFSAPLASPHQLHLHVVSDRDDEAPWGCRLEIPIARDGRFTIPQLPAVPHRLLVVGSGMARQRVWAAHRVEVGRGETTSVEIDPPVVGVDVAVEVRSSRAVAVQGAVLGLFRGRLSPPPTTGLELLEVHARSSLQGRSRIEHTARPSGKDAVALRFEDVEPGDYTLCGAALPGDVRDPDVRDRLWAQRARIPIRCVALDVSEVSAQQTVTLEVPPMARLLDE